METDDQAAHKKPTGRKKNRKIIQWIIFDSPLRSLSRSRPRNSGINSIIKLPTNKNVKTLAAYVKIINRKSNTLPNTPS